MDFSAAAKQVELGHRQQANLRHQRRNLESTRLLRKQRDFLFQHLVGPVANTRLVIAHLAQRLDHRIEILDTDIAKLVARDGVRAEQPQGQDDLALHIGFGLVRQHFEHQLILRIRRAGSLDADAERLATLLVESNRRNHELADLLRHQLQAVPDVALVVAVDEAEAGGITVIENNKMLLKTGEIRLTVGAVVERKHQLKGLVHAYRVAIDANLYLRHDRRCPGAGQQQRDKQKRDRVQSHHGWASASAPPRLRCW